MFNQSAMSPLSPRQPASSAALAAVRGFWALLGDRIREARLARHWTVERLAAEAGLSRGVVYRTERGDPGSLEAAMRLTTALGLKLEFDLIDPRRRAPSGLRQADIVHSAMGELEAGWLRPLGYQVGIDEPYQHYQFAGRADVVAWSIEACALLHIENRTRFPDLQEVAGSYNAKRAYLAGSIGQRVGVSRWASETHVIAALWSAEVLHMLRLRRATFASICPDRAAVLGVWLAGMPPSTGRTSSLIILDPLAAGRQRPFIDLDTAMTARPRHSGYADTARRLAGGQDG
jgi:transcriptional regulator with XRE-family HTH domain